MGGTSGFGGSVRGRIPVVAAGLWILYGEGGTRTCGFGLEECAAGRTESFAFFPFAGALTLLDESPFFACLVFLDGSPFVGSLTSLLDSPFLLFKADSERLVGGWDVTSVKYVPCRLHHLGPHSQLFGR